MTYKFSNKSEQILNTVRLELNILAHKVLEISPIDFTIVEGYRDIERQKQLYKAIFCKIYPAAGWLYRDRQETIRTA